MDIRTLKSHIMTKQILSYYIFTGEEWKVQQLYIQQVAKCLGFPIIYIDQFKDIYRKLINKSFISKSAVYVVRDDPDLLGNEKLQEQLSDILIGNVLIHILTSVDKRTKFYKKYSEQLIEFEVLPDKLLNKYIKKNIDLSDKNCAILIDICEHNYGRILLEIDKIRRYAQDNVTLIRNIENSAFEILLKDGTIYEPPYDAVFDFVDAVLDRKINRSFGLLEQSYAVGESTLVLLSVLYNNAKAVLQLQTYEGKEVSKGTGLTGWQIKNAKPHINKYSTAELIRILQLINKVERGIKSGGMEEQFAMPYLLCKIL